MRERLAGAGRESVVAEDFDGRAIELAAGESLTVELLEGPQVVHLFALNRNDPDERYWAQETCLIEGLFLTRSSRLWGTMARFRPLLTVLEDTVADRPTGPGVAGKHHPAYGGAGTPAAWRAAGGRAAVSAWEQLAALLTERGLRPALIKDEACLFQKSRIDPHARRLEIEASDALAGDAVALYAEIDLVVLLALSPFLDGACSPAGNDPRPRAVALHTTGALAEPLAWPYPDVPYPDISLYEDATGKRTDRSEPTAGRG